MRSLAVILMLVLYTTALPVLPASKRPSLSLGHGSPAFLSTKPSALVCASISALRAALVAHNGAGCANWRGGVKVQVVSWSHDTLGMSPRIFFTVVRVRGSDEQFGVVSIAQLIPVVPRGTGIRLVEPCSSGAAQKRAPTATVMSQPEGSRGMRVLVQMADGSTRLVGIRAVTDVKGCPIDRFREDDVAGRPSCCGM